MPIEDNCAVTLGMFMVKRQKLKVKIASKKAKGFILFNFGLEIGNWKLEIGNCIASPILNLADLGRIVKRRADWGFKN